jgi:integrase
MKHHTTLVGTTATLQDVTDGIAGHPELSATRKRDLRSAIATYGRLVERPLGEIPLDLQALRQTFDTVVPAQAKISRKRWANLRSDVAAAIAASGLRPMLQTARVALSSLWQQVLSGAGDKSVSLGLSRLAHWASDRQLGPEQIDGAVLETFFAELETGSLVRNLKAQHRTTIKCWNRLVRLAPERQLRPQVIPACEKASSRVAWAELPASFRDDADKYVRWCAVLDPLDEHARARRLAPATLRLRLDYIHLAASAALAAGIEAARLISLASLVEPEIFRVILRQQWQARGRKITNYLRDLASGLIVIASEWVKVPERQQSQLKDLRSKLGHPPSGLTEKNKGLLRQFDDGRLLEGLICLPDPLWRRARRNMSKSRLAFVDLQNALAIDILLHVPMRIENLAALKFDEHVHWPQGRGKPALVVIGKGETKNEVPLEFELPKVLADRLYSYRNEIAPAVIGCRPDHVFVTLKSTPRKISTLRVAIERTVLRCVGMKITPHQFRHLAAKINLEANPGAYELVRQLLGHKIMRTTTRFYAGPDTRRAGRAHAELIRQLRQPSLKRRRHRREDESE